MDEELANALKRVVLAYYEGRDEMARIAMDALEAAGFAPHGRGAPPKIRRLANNPQDSGGTPLA